jgi:hypothetical protein
MFLCPRFFGAGTRAGFVKSDFPSQRVRLWLFGDDSVRRGERRVTISRRKEGHTVGPGPAEIQSRPNC